MTEQATAAVAPEQAQQLAPPQAPIRESLPATVGQRFAYYNKTAARLHTIDVRGSVGQGIFARFLKRYPERRFEIEDRWYRKQKINLGLCKSRYHGIINTNTTTYKLHDLCHGPNAVSTWRVHNVFDRWQKVVSEVEAGKDSVLRPQDLPRRPPSAPPLGRISAVVIRPAVEPGGIVQSVEIDDDQPVPAAPTQLQSNQALRDFTIINDDEEEPMPRAQNTSQEGRLNESNGKARQALQGQAPPSRNAVNNPATQLSDHARPDVPASSFSGPVRRVAQPITTTLSEIESRTVVDLTKDDSTSPSNGMKAPQMQRLAPAPSRTIQANSQRTQTSGTQWNVVGQQNGQIQMEMHAPSNANPPNQLNGQTRQPSVTFADSTRPSQNDGTMGSPAPLNRSTGPMAHQTVTPAPHSNGFGAGPTNPINTQYSLPLGHGAGQIGGTVPVNSRSSHQNDETIYQQVSYRGNAQVLSNNRQSRPTGQTMQVSQQNEISQTGQQRPQMQPASMASFAQIDSRTQPLANGQAKLRAQLQKNYKRILKMYSLSDNDEAKLWNLYNALYKAICMKDKAKEAGISTQIENLTLKQQPQQAAVQQINSSSQASTLENEPQASPENEAFVQTQQSIEDVGQRSKTLHHVPVPVRGATRVAPANSSTANPLPQKVQESDPSQPLTPEAHRLLIETLKRDYHHRAQQWNLNAADSSSLREFYQVYLSARKEGDASRSGAALNAIQNFRRKYQQARKSVKENPAKSLRNSGARNQNEFPASGLSSPYQSNQRTTMGPPMPHFSPPNQTNTQGPAPGLQRPTGQMAMGISYQQSHAPHQTNIQAAPSPGLAFNGSYAQNGRSVSGGFMVYGYQEDQKNNQLAQTPTTVFNGYYPPDSQLTVEAPIPYGYQGNQMNYQFSQDNTKTTTDSNIGTEPNKPKKTSDKYFAAHDISFPMRGDRPKLASPDQNNTSIQYRRNRNRNPQLDHLSIDLNNLASFGEITMPIMRKWQEVKKPLLLLDDSLDLLGKLRSYANTLAATYLKFQRLSPKERATRERWVERETMRWQILVRRGMQAKKPAKVEVKGLLNDLVLGSYPAHPPEWGLTMSRNFGQATEQNPVWDPNIFWGLDLILESLPAEQVQVVQRRVPVRSKDVGQDWNWGFDLFGDGEDAPEQAPLEQLQPVQPQVPIKRKRGRPPKIRAPKSGNTPGATPSSTSANRGLEASVDDDLEHLINSTQLSLPKKTDSASAAANNDQEKKYKNIEDEPWFPTLPPSPPLPTVWSRYNPHQLLSASIELLKDYRAVYKKEIKARGIQNKNKEKEQMWSCFLDIHAGKFDDDAQRVTGATSGLREMREKLNRKGYTLNLTRVEQHENAEAEDQGLDVMPSADNEPAALKHGKKRRATSLDVESQPAAPKRRKGEPGNSKSKSFEMGAEALEPPETASGRNMERTLGSMFGSQQPRVDAETSQEPPIRRKRGRPPKKIPEVTVKNGEGSPATGSAAKPIALDEEPSATATELDAQPEDMENSTPTKVPKGRPTSHDPNARATRLKIRKSVVEIKVLRSLTPDANSPEAREKPAAPERTTRSTKEANNGAIVEVEAVEGPPKALPSEEKVTRTEAEATKEADNSAIVDTEAIEEPPKAALEKRMTRREAEATNQKPAAGSLWDWWKLT